MNENLNLVEILKDCPKGTKFYSSIYGELIYSYTYVSPSGAKFVFILPNSNSMFNNIPIKVEYCWNGKYIINMGECTLFPSKEQRDWSKFKPKKPKFDPKTLRPFDKVLVRDSDGCRWRCAFYSHTRENKEYKYMTMHLGYKRCIPYNNDTEHLIDTTDEAPEYYRYWEE